MVLPSRLLALALEHHKSGDLAQAEQIYQQILQTDPQHVDALHHLGAVATQRGQHELAIEYFGKAIALNGQVAAMHYNLGCAHQALGKLDPAAASYQEALRINPSYVEAHHNLGVVFRERGQFAAAEARFRQVLNLRPNHAVACNHLGLALAAQKKPSAAARSYQQAIELNPDYAEAHNNLGNALVALGQMENAAASYRKAVECNAELFDAHYNLGCVLAVLKRMDEAIECYRQVIAAKPQMAEAQHRLGVALAAQGRLQEALVSLRRAIEFNPELVETHFSLGNTLHSAGMHAEAKQSYRNAVRLEPSHVGAQSGLARILEAEGLIDEAHACLEVAARHEPRRASLHYKLGRLATKQRKFNQAEEYLRRAVEMAPANAAAHEALGAVLAGQGCWAESLQMLARANELEPSDARKLKRSAVLPVIAESVEQMHRHRRRMQEGVKELLAGNPKIADPLGLGTLDFYVAYHGCNERDWRGDLARLYLKACRGLDYVAPQCRDRGRRAPAAGPIKVGFISQHLRTHTIGRLNVGLIEQLDRERFHVTVIRPAKQDDELARRINQAADQIETIAAAGNLQAARERIAALDLDAIVYPDIGMEPWTYLLAFSRLAPVQCVTWGHPLTTGIPTVDYFISSERLEIAGADEHYTEQLVRLPSLTVYYERPTLPVRPKGRVDFALPEDANLYGCLQTVFKFHPEFDSILADILRRDVKGLLVLMGGTRTRWNELLLRRFRSTMPDVVERVRLVAPQKYSSFLGLTALCDVMLDPLHFGGGNTCYEALAFGVPVVTLPSEFLRGRIAQALYYEMNLLDCVVTTPEQYAALAVRLGTDRAYRQVMREKILAANSVLFESGAGVQQLENFLAGAVAKAYAG